MTLFVGFTTLVFACAYVLGALFGLPQFKRKPPKQTIPLANVVKTFDWQKLEVPAFKRRQKIGVIDA